MGGSLGIARKGDRVRIVFMLFFIIVLTVSLTSFGLREKKEKPVAQRQEMVIGTLALLSSLFMVAF